MSGDDGERYFYGVFVDVTDEKLAQKRAGELYEKELAYFVQAASAEGSIQGRVNITQDRVESYHSTEAAAITQKGETYEKAIGKLAAAASEPEYGKYLRTALDRANVVAEFAAGKIIMILNICASARTAESSGAGRISGSIRIRKAAT